MPQRKENDYAPRIRQGSHVPVRARHVRASPVIVVDSLVAAILALEAFLTFRLVRRFSRDGGRGRTPCRFRDIVASFGGLFAAALPLYVMPLMKSIMGDAADWEFAWAMLPEFRVVVFAVSAFALARLAIKALKFFKEMV